MTTSYFMLQFIREKRGVMKKPLKLEPTAQNIQVVTQCRICLEDGNIPIYNNSNLLFDVEDAIRTFGDIEIKDDDLHPKHLCETCKFLLIGAVSFRESAKESDRILRLNWTANLIKPSEVENDSSNFSSESTDNVQKCETCNLEFKVLEEYSIHKTSKHHKNVRIQCPICLKLVTLKLYKDHIMLRHRSASHLICEVCGKLYSKNNLVRHLQLHSYDLPFQCQKCPYRGRFKDSLRIHMRTHFKVKPFSCDTCKQQFITRSNLNRHLLTHKKEKPHKCIECGRGFYFKRDLQVHLNADHTGMKDFGCQMCENKYSTRKALMRHELSIHKRDKMAKGRMPLYLQAEYKKSDDIK